MITGITSFWNLKVLFLILLQTLRKTNPFYLWHNPIIFIVEVCAIITTIFAFKQSGDRLEFWFNFSISFWIWVTVLLSNLIESLAEIKSKIQAEKLKQNRHNLMAYLVTRDGRIKEISALLLKTGDIVIVNEGMIIPSDGNIVEGAALIDESVITGESAPVVREAGKEKVKVMGGTRVINGEVRIEIRADAGATFVDRMIYCIENTKRNLTSNEKMLEIFLISSSIVFFAVIFNFAVFSKGLNYHFSFITLFALFVCLLPTTVGGLLPVVSIVGMERLLRRNVITIDGKAIDIASEVDIVFIDKTGTITLGNRLATNFFPVSSVSKKELIKYAMLASLADETPEGRSIVVLAKNKLAIRGRDIKFPRKASFIEFSAETSISGIDIDDQKIRKGSMQAIEQFVGNSSTLDEAKRIAEKIAKDGGTPILVADAKRVFGVISLKDVLKRGIKERLSRLKNMGISSVMVTGDNPLTAAAIAAEAGIDDFIASATPILKLKKIKQFQNEGYVVAMIGDGVNDAPALAQANIGVAMNIGTQPAREAANFVDLDSSPAKLLDIITIGKQTSLTRGAITTFSIFNDLLKYLIILPAIFAPQYPFFAKLNLINLKAPNYVILSVLISSALSIPVLMPLAFYSGKLSYFSIKGLLKKNLLMFGLGGIIFGGMVIKLIDYICFGWL